MGETQMMTSLAEHASELLLTDPRIASHLDHLADASWPDEIQRPETADESYVWWSLRQTALLGLLAKIAAYHSAEL
jgi:hypothetical protein